MYVLHMIQNTCRDQGPFAETHKQIVDFYHALQHAHADKIHLAIQGVMPAFPMGSRAFQHTVLSTLITQSHLSCREHAPPFPHFVVFVSLYISNTFSLSSSFSLSYPTSHNPNQPLPESLTVSVYDEYHAAPLVAQLQRRLPKFRLRNGQIPGNADYDDPRDDVSHRRERQRRRCRHRRRRRVPLRVPREPRDALAAAPFRPPAGTGCFCVHGAEVMHRFVDLAG